MSSPAETRFLLRGLFSIGLIALLLSRVHWQELTALLRQVHIIPLVAGALCIGGCQFLIAARTRISLGQWDIKLPYFRMLTLTWLGQFCNTFLPGSTGGDAVKFLRLCRIVPERKAAGLAALVADRLVALVALVVLAGGALLFGEQQFRRQILSGAFQRFSPVFFIVLGATMGVGTLGLWWAWRRYALRLGHFAGRLRLTAVSLRTGFKPSPALGLALGLALVVHLLTTTGCWLFCRALWVPASFGQLMLVIPLIMVAVLLPLTVNGHGLREYALFFYFQQWHLASTLPGGSDLRETIVALSLLMVMSDFFWSLPGGLCLLLKTEPAVKGPDVLQAIRPSSGRAGEEVPSESPLERVQKAEF